MATMDNILYKYKNGNTDVTILNDGTKIREYEDTPLIVHPESIDCKITNYCDMGCKYCHENSTTNGKHADLDKLKAVLSELQSGAELAIGGGNPLSHPNLVEFLTWLKSRGIIANITVNQGHLFQYKDLLFYLIKEDLVKGIGISIVNEDFDIVKELLQLTNNIVYHLIAGVNNINIVDKLIDLGKCKILILGYKDFGRGINFHSEATDILLKEWYIKLPKYIGKCIISFDNLAIEQLNVKRLLTKKAWDNFYMGDDFTFTMYIDAVKQEYAPTSRNNDRESFDKFSLIEYFKTRNK